MNSKIITTSRELLTNARINKWNSLNIVNLPTFTPYANPLKCSAHCHYCSEDLVLKNSMANSSSRLLIKDYDKYFYNLSNCINFLKNNYTNINLSLSGLEATIEPIWFRSLIKTISDNDIFPNKTLYTNGSGLQYLDEMSNKILDRIELHRDHYDENKNQKIMRIENKYSVRLNKYFKECFQKSKEKTWLVCILSRQGINSIDDICNYCDFAISLGVKGIIFRNLCKLDTNNYKNNYTLNYINENSLSMENIITNFVDNNNLFNFLRANKGYYYYNEEYSFGDSNLTVIFEECNYDTLKDLETKNITHKLVFFSNGNLCNGWNPFDNVIKKF